MALARHEWTQHIPVSSGPDPPLPAVPGHWRRRNSQNHGRVSSRSHRKSFRVHSPISPLRLHFREMDLDKRQACCSLKIAENRNPGVHPDLTWVEVSLQSAIGWLGDSPEDSDLGHGLEGRAPSQ